MVEYLIRKIKAEAGNENIKVIATGGLSEIVAGSGEEIDVVDRTLTLRGLYLIYKMNKENDK